MQTFNEFIHDANLRDHNLLNAVCSLVVGWIDSCFLLSGKSFPIQHSMVRENSGHCPIELVSNEMNWVTCPFQFKYMRLEHPGFKELRVVACSTN